MDWVPDLLGVAIGWAVVVCVVWALVAVNMDDWK